MTGRPAAGVGPDGSARLRNDRTAICPDCHGPKLHKARRCRACSDAEKARRKRARCACPRCGGQKSPTSRPEALCRRCFVAGRALVTICPACDGRKEGNAKLCLACHKRRLGTDHVWQGIVPGFDPEAFRRLRERDDIEFTPLQIEDGCGVSASTIKRWERGIQKPRKVELDAVMVFLAFRPCGHCDGQGYVEGSPLPLPIAHRAAPPEGRAVGRLVLYPDDGFVACGTRTLDLSPHRLRLLQLLTSAPGRTFSTEEIAAELWPTDPPKDAYQSIRSAVNYLRRGLEGIGLPNVLRTRHGRGWYVALPDAGKASA